MRTRLLTVCMLITWTACERPRDLSTASSLMAASMDPAASPMASAPSVSPVASAYPPAASGAPPVTSPSCDFWGGRGFSVEASSYGGNAAQYRVVSYGDATRVASMEDSDHYFVAGKETKPPRKIQRRLTLSEAEADALAGALMGTCPTPEERASECAPGGCAMLTVTTADGSKRTAGIVQGGAAFARVEKRLSALFPEVRQ